MVPREDKGSETAGPGRTIGLLGVHTHTLTASHDNSTVTQDIKVASAVKVGPRGSPPMRPRPYWVLPLGQLRKGGAARVDLGPGRGEQAGWSSRPGWVEATSLQGLQHQQLFQHLRLACLSDFTCQEHLIYHCVNLSKGGRQGKAGVREGRANCCSSQPLGTKWCHPE